MSNLFDDILRLRYQELLDGQERHRQAILEGLDLSDKKAIEVIISLGYEAVNLGWNIHYLVQRRISPS